MTTLTTQDNIARLADSFTSKVTADDIANTDDKLHNFLVEFAHEAVNTYTGTFTFMVNMKQYTKYGLSDSQVAGVVNCVLADYRYNHRKAAVQQAEQIVATTPVNYDHSRQYVADGYYTVQGNTSHRTIRLQTVKDSDGVKQWLSYLSGSDNVGDYTSIGMVVGNEVRLFKKNVGKYTDIVAATKYVIKNVDKLGEFGKNYAMRSGNCFRCNRLLTTPESVALGLGPICAAK